MGVLALPSELGGTSSQGHRSSTSARDPLDFMVGFCQGFKFLPGLSSWWSPTPPRGTLYLNSLLIFMGPTSQSVGPSGLGLSEGLDPGKEVPQSFLVSGDAFFCFAYQGSIQVRLGGP